MATVYIPCIIRVCTCMNVPHIHSKVCMAKKNNPTQIIPYTIFVCPRMSPETVLISEKDSVNLNELQGHVNNWREIICDFAKECFHVAT